MSGTTLISSEDHRKLLIDIFFAVIITIGFEKFLHTFLLPNIDKLGSFDIPTLLSTFSAPPLIFNMFFFFVAYFWVISHWIFYHELIKKYPYYRCGKFLVDVAIFSIMFVIINISFLAYDSTILPLFILLIVIWYLFACLWHLSDRGLRPLQRYLILHGLRLATYVPLLVLAYDPFSLGLTYDWYRYIIMSSIIVAMIVWNVHRLKKYLDRDLREYNCDYVEGHPYWSSQTNGGKLSIEIHKRSKMVKNNKEKKEDRLVFVAPNPGKRPIPAKMVLKGRIVAGTNKGLEEEQDEDDYVTIELPWYENGNIVRPMFKVRQETVKEVLAGISELIREDKKPEETKNLEYL